MTRVLTPSDTFRTGVYQAREFKVEFGNMPLRAMQSPTTICVRGGLEGIESGW